MGNWHGFDSVKSNNVEAALVQHGLDWNVGRFPAYTKIGDKFVEVPHRNFTVRMDEDLPFDAVGPNYRVMQNKEGFQFLNELVDQDGLEIETALEYQDGRQVGVVARVPDNITVGEDTFHKYLMWINNHDGKGSFQVFGCDTCVTCGNAFQVTKRTAKDKFTIPHTRKMSYRLQKAREAIKLSFKQTDELKIIADKLMNQKITKYDRELFFGLLTDMNNIDREKNPKKYTRAAGIRSTIREIHRERDYIENYRDTRWGLLQATTDYVTNVKRYRNTHTRFADLVEGPALNIRALELLTA